MKKKPKKNKKQGRIEVDKDKLYKLRDLCSVDLRGKMEIMAGFAQEMIRLGPETVFLAAVPKGADFFFLPTEIFSDDHKISVQRQVIEWATENGADCIVSATTAWSSPSHPHLRPSVHPQRKEILSVVAKDQFKHVAAMQEIHRRGKKVSFGELEYFDSVLSWLDEYPGFDRSAATG